MHHRRLFATLLALVLIGAFFVVSAPAEAQGNFTTKEVRIDFTQPQQFASPPANLNTDQGLGLPSEADTLTSLPIAVPSLSLSAPFLSVSILWESPSQAFREALIVRMRGSVDGNVWSAWQTAEEILPSAFTNRYGSGLFSFSPQTRFVQYHLAWQQALLIKSATIFFTDVGADPTGTAPPPPSYPKPNIVSRTAWGCPQGQNSPNWTPVETNVKHLIVHHTATPNGESNWAARVRSIWNYHAVELGWGDIGYNYLVDYNGVIYEGRAGSQNGEKDIRAAHDGVNTGSMGVSLIGNFQDFAPSSAMLNSLKQVLAWKASQRGINPTGSANYPGANWQPVSNIAGHRDVNSTLCPGQMVYNLLPSIRSDVAAMISNSNGPNLLQNTQFETTASPWSVILNEKQCAWTRYDGVGRGGSKALAVHRPSADRCPSFWQDVSFSAQVGQTITAVMYGQRGWDGPTPRGRLVIWGFGGTVESVGKSFSLRPGWQCTWVQYTPATSGKTSLRYEIYIDSIGQPDYQFDDLSLAVGTNIPSDCDVTPPNVTITTPTEGAFVNSNSLTIDANATDSGFDTKGVASVHFHRLVGSNWTLLASDFTAPYSLTTSLSALSDGTHRFGVKAIDFAGNETAIIPRNIVLDRTPPTGIMVAPTPNFQTSAKRIAMRANAADATSGVDRVEYFAWSPEPWSNQIWIKIGTVSTAPYEFTWSISHIKTYAFLMARIIDKAGNVRETSGDGNWTWFSVNLRPHTIGIFRPSNAVFYLRNQNTTGPADFTVVMGEGADIPVAGDWNGNGIDTIGIYRQSTGMFYLKNENTTGAPVVYQFALGNPGDVPFAGDWNGNGRDGVGVFRPSNGIIYMKNTLTTGFADYAMVYGIANDKPVAGDWDGDGKDSVGIYRGDTFFLTNQTCNDCIPTANHIFVLGNAGDVPFAGDWNANGIDGVGVFRPTNGITYFKNALTTGFADISMVYGIAGDRPIAGVWMIPSGDQPSAQVEATPSDSTHPELAPTFVPRN
ncbi:N-acetylmuramoyl-L-alanine amidase [Chloroflexi bacterium CFX3]|nr:N-acetylmuramoyl-L-alanine amidase [Chloroflexi bacterium CFX3]